VLYVQRVHDDVGTYSAYCDRVIDGIHAQAGAARVWVVFWPEGGAEAPKVYASSDLNRSLEEAKAEVRRGRAEPDAGSFNGGLEYCAKLARLPSAHIVVVGRGSLFEWLGPSEARARKDAIRAAARMCKVDAILVGAPVAELADVVNGIRISVEW